MWKNKIKIVLEKNIGEYFFNFEVVKVCREIILKVVKGNEFN